MSQVDVFRAYAAAFEQVFKKDDWSVLEPYFTEDAVYETIADAPFAGKHEGRDAILSHLKQSLDSFDRRFDSRELAIQEGPVDRDDGTVWMKWRVIYRVGDAPALVMEGEETATFEGERMSRLEDRFTPETSALAAEWFAKHGSQLGPAGS